MLPVVLALLLPAAAGDGAASPVLFVAADPAHQLAAHELQRYLHLCSSDGLAASELRTAAPGDGAGRGAASHGLALTTAEAWSQRLPALVGPDSLTPPSTAAVATLAERLRSGTADDHALLAVETTAGGRVIVVLGATDQSVLAGAYSLIERLTPVRFQLHGDILPDRTGALPELEHLFLAGHDALSAAVVLSPGNVRVRGLQPFHDFAEGPDWWNAAEYKLLLDQMAKMKLNLIALHNYGESLVEPTVWTGLENDFDHTTGRLKKNGTYAASYITTASGATWGGNPMNISDYLFGAQTAFASDCYGSDAMRRAGGCPDPMLSPSTPAAAQRVGAFEGVADMLTEAFRWGRAIGIQSCVGIEACDGTPNCANPKGDVDPPQYPGNRSAALKEYFRGTLLRINATYQSEYFWLWAGEGWAPRINASIPMSDPAIQGVVDGFQALHEAKVETGLNVALATSGWTLGPRGDRAYFDSVLPEGFVMSSINEKIGLQNVEPAYANVSRHRDAWSIPWLEDDSAMNGVQLWANRTLVFAADAVEVGGASGLLGIHWRTTDVAPQATALAQWPWHRTLTTKELYEDLVAAEFGLATDSPLTQRIASIFESLDSFGSQKGGPLAPPRPGVEVQTPGWPGYDPHADFSRINEFLSVTRVAIPRPIVWGPGRLDNTFEVEPATFRFVDEFESLRDAVATATESAPLPLARFDRWLATFQYLRAAGEVGDAWRRIAIATGKAVDAIRGSDGTTFGKLWAGSLVPLRAELINKTSDMVTLLTATVSDTGSLGALANAQQYMLPMMTRSTDLAYDALHGARCKPGPAKCYDEHTAKGRVFPFVPGGGGGEYAPGSCSDTLTDERCARVAHMSHAWCAMICHAADPSYKHAAVEGKGGNECRCAKVVDPSIETRPMSECGAPCAGENGTLCGGDWRAAGFAFTCSSSDAVPPAPLPPELRWESHRGQGYRGPERLVVMTPRGRLGADERLLRIQAIAFAATAFASPPTVMFRAMGSTKPFEKALMRRAAATRGVWSAELEVSGSLEYYVAASTAHGRLSWPAGGAANAHTVLVV